ncbi:MAG: hypothetical protein JWP81_2465 [Ferruginibacter sp.]|nr:hypothetical protein [Ferruginibacter sp.]
MKKLKLSLSLRLVRGAIGKRIVIKHYSYGIIKTKFPNMTNIVATPAQCQCRSLFKEAVTFASSIMADPIEKKRWQQKKGIKHRLFNALIKHYMQQPKKAKPTAARLTEKLLNICLRKPTKNTWPLNQPSVKNKTQLTGAYPLIKNPIPTSITDLQLH